MRLRLLLFFGLAFLSVYGSANFLTGLHGWRWPMATPDWPFWPSWSYIYVSLDLLLPLAFWRVTADRTGLLTAALLLATLLAWPCFLLFPLAAIPLPAAELNPAFQLADALNLEANFFPSLHVAYALIAAAFLSASWAWLWAVLIAFSTLVTHQHYTVDVIGGAALAWLACRWVAGPGRLEGLCLAEVGHCAARHRRYALIGLGLLAASLGRWKTRRLARVGFCYLQHLDDILDGHRLCEGEPEQVATAHQKALLGEGSFPEGAAGELGECLKGELESRSTEGVARAVALIEEMKLDRRRVRDQLLLDEAELDRHLEQTFELSLDLMLLAADSPIRARQVPHLVKSLGWCSVVRDYAEDCSMGLVNIPEPVWLGGTAESWLEHRHRAVHAHLRRAESELRALEGVRGQRLLEIFLRSVKRYAGPEGGGGRPGNLGP